MIATLRGEITIKEEDSLIVEVGGVGMRVHVPATLREQMNVGESIFLYTHFVIRQDAMSLFGFESQGDRDLYTLLLSVNRVGPKLALAILSSLSLDTIKRAVFNEEFDILNRVPGVGKKTAQRIVLSLQDKLKPTDALEQVASMSDTDGEVLAALTALGYSVVEAQTAIQSIPKDAPKDIEERLRLALGYFQ
ncbi:MAG: Holliday junction branch migration protein RuvA [Anaerolineae bacterium]|jgi:Holliday junction DNA helicase RuvA|nr:Holliday junction branch migration protein RuvA [Anaerolineae bacterium]MBT3714025.1 Holliday junction branch migration protein RuvA [Anaerolineae bacterium]MBT4312475.1 Holliday junction branch migration protein RuvA [Anaerolineae bacterium]MBT4458733.1 Holliday junction branch migration protein RuvA [Anaerolineae bacterium]MBT4842257.1 Holliday junction branch migration protein RuvA [Anaerolineae bacterium]